MSDFASRGSPERDNRMLWGALAAASAWWLTEAAIHVVVFDEGPLGPQLLPENAHELWMRSLVFVMFVAFGAYANVIVNRINRARTEQRRLQESLEGALTKVLSGFLPICASCKKIRAEGGDPEDQASWHRLESYLGERTDLQFSHSLCPACELELYSERPGHSREHYED